MLVYRDLNIGTAKPLAAEQAGIKHYLIDICEPDDNFTVADFQRLAAQYISEINSRHKIPLIVGGTGLYVRALLEGYDLTTPAGDAELRQQLQQLAIERGNMYMYELLTKNDPMRASMLHPNDIRRVIRALELHSLSDTAKINTKASNLQYNTLVIGLSMERKRLYERIDQRVDIMIKSGLIDEVRGLLKRGVLHTSQSMQAIGYKELFNYLNGEATLEQAIAAIKVSTRHFAKRQLTWYRKMPYISWLDPTDYSSELECVEKIYNLVAEKFYIE